MLLPDSSVDPDAYTWFAKSGGGFFDFGETLGPNGNGDSFVIPEPATMLLFGSGLIGTFLRRKRRS